jgi:hypothetical protein
MELNTPNPPNHEQFGLTQDRINYFDKIIERYHLIIFLSAIANLFICFIIFYFIFPNTGIPLLFYLFIGFCAGTGIGEKITNYRITKAERLSDYPNYINFKKALIDHNEALKAYNDLQRKIMRDDYRKQIKEKILTKNGAEWWHGIDGRRFEIEVTKILMSKKYNVKHTGSSFGDKGIDLLLKLDDKTIIIQCKAYKNYISAGIVRELYGTLIHEKADEAWLVVTSGFYSGAKDFACNKPIRLLTIRNLMKLPPNEPTKRVKA